MADDDEITSEPSSGASPYGFDHIGKTVLYETNEEGTICTIVRETDRALDPLAAPLPRRRLTHTFAGGIFLRPLASLVLSLLCPPSLAVTRQLTRSVHGSLALCPSRCSAAPSLAAADSHTFPCARLPASQTLNRPDSMNSMSPDLIQAACAALSIAASDPEVRVVILTGAGRGAAYSASFPVCVACVTFETLSTF